MEISTKKNRKNFYTRIGLSIILFIAVYFVLTNALQYFSFTEKAYGPYFWPRVNWVFPHVVCGIVALLIGPFQFSNQLRAKYLKIHRRSGYVYLTAVLIGGIAGIGLAITSQVNLIMHHADFQALEGSWRGLHYTVNNTETDESLKIRVFNISKKVFEYGREKERNTRNSNVPC